MSDQKELAKIQKNVVIILNEPSHNPTGFRMTYEEWVNLMNFFKEKFNFYLSLFYFRILY